MLKYIWGIIESPEQARLVIEVDLLVILKYQELKRVWGID